MEIKKFLYTEMELEDGAIVQKLVDDSIKYHTVKDICDGDENKIRTNRFVGTMGEFAFADMYGFCRPIKSYGADDGQDNGMDFPLNVDGKIYSIDVKSMKRQTNNFTEEWVLNIPYRQVVKPESLTDYYCGINIHYDNYTKIYTATIIGFVSKNDILSGKVGKLYKAGSVRTSDDGHTIDFKQDTYEVKFDEFIRPFKTKTIIKNRKCEKIKTKEIEYFYKNELQLI